ncbi:Rap1a/Tai family immunity protein [Dechloromonas agitata]|uniref:Rap1a/Tai family immunity protein n=1 Tax=Dechloromonas agitata TaxID=73030 RepID=UPI00048114FA|nr:Rap1a/Tai family immunity protein [Dechloromonas agitata]MDE1545460.1 Rap1a/Tai family immunity protein [Dechloromonas agitata]
MRYFCLLAALFALPAHAYTPGELRGDCQAAEELYANQKNSDPFQSIRSARCIAYVAGFADGYAVSDYLAGQVGMKLNAFCLPNDPDLSRRLVRAVTIHVERVPPNTTMSTATLVAGALAKAFPCTESLEPKK